MVDSNRSNTASRFSKSSFDWVWFSTNESIVNRRVSVLAIAEIPIATCLFWWWASFSPWPWLTLLAFIATPLLLLRSPASVETGTRKLRSFWTREERKPSGLILLFLVSISIGLVGWIGCGVASRWVIWREGWMLYLFGATLVVFALVVLVGCVASLIVAFRFAGALPSFSLRLRARVGRFADVIQVILAPFLTAGFTLITLVIRIVSTVTHWRSGLTLYSSNCFENLFVIDLKHLPELVPGAKSVHPLLSLDGMWKSVVERRSGVQRSGLRHSFNVFYAGVFSSFVLLSTTAYRLNLKANFWLWGPIAYAFSPAVWVNDSKTRPVIANVVHGLVQAFMLALLCACLVVLGKPWLSDAMLSALKDVSGKFLGELLDHVGTIPLISARYLVLTFLGCSLGWLLALTFLTNNAHGAVYANQADWKQLNELERTNPRTDAVRVLQVLRLNLALAFIAAWIFIFWAVANATDASMRSNYLFWDWIRPLL